MDLRQLEFFTTVVACGSISDAARELYVSQPLLSMQIQSLEKELNLILFDRSTRPFKLTRAGSVVYKYAHDVLGLTRILLRDLDEGNKSALRIGASSVPATYILPEVLRKFRLEYPQTEFLIQQGDSLSIINKVSEGILDLGLVGTQLGDKNCQYFPLIEDELVFITPNEAQYQEVFDQLVGSADAAGASGATAANATGASTATATPGAPADTSSPANSAANASPQVGTVNKAALAKLMELPYILREQGSGTQEAAFRACETLGIDTSKLRVVARMESQEAICHAVCNGLGVSIVSRRAARVFAERGCVLSFELPLQHQRVIYLVHNTAHKLPQEMQEFRLFLINELAEKNTPFED